MPNFKSSPTRTRTMNLATFCLVFCSCFAFNILLPQSGQHTDQNTLGMLTWSYPAAEAKKSKKRKRKRYNKRQREAKKLIDAGHPTIEITLKTSPRVRASVYHGKELLGTTPLRLVWPKDTGALDIKLKAAGYLTVNSRIYTHRNDRVTVNMFKTDQAHLLFGYKKKVKETIPSEDGEE